MVFFYGGDYKEGGESFILYSGRHMAQSSNTILIIPNYRISVMGWLFSGNNQVDPNVGIQDQVRRFCLLSLDKLYIQYFFLKKKKKNQTHNTQKLILAICNCLGTSKR